MVCHKIYQDQIKEKYLFDKDIEKVTMIFTKYL